eukprot:jgi/Mesvir1/4732/Mv25186-RA.1
MTQEGGDGVQNPLNGMEPGIAASGGGGGAAGRPYKPLIPQSFLPPKLTHKFAAKVGTWDCDMFEMDLVFTGCTLRFTAWEVFNQHNLFNLFNIHKGRLLRFLQLIEAGMIGGNGYHNGLHVADVVSNVSYFLQELGSKRFMNDVDVLSAVLAAIIHDFRHPSVSNDYLINTSHHLAICYNDRSVLENYHLAEAFRLLQKPEYNFMSGMSEDDVKRVRKNVIAIVLATDLKQHFAVLDQFQAISEQLTACAASAKQHELPDHVRLAVVQMTMKCGDIGHLAKKRAYHTQWVERINAESFAQGDKERASGLPISSFCDRQNQNVPKAQVGFYNFVAIPMFKAWFAVFGSDNEVSRELQANFEYWKELERLGEISKEV